MISVLWRGGELDRLLDEDHAALGERWGSRRPPRWQHRSEVTYNVYGDRGSIDDLAYDEATATLLVTELKTGIYDAQRTVAKLDEKVPHRPRRSAPLRMAGPARCARACGCRNANEPSPR